MNCVDVKGLKQGKWKLSYPKLRGEPGYDEEGEYKNDRKDGKWRAIELRVARPNLTIRTRKGYNAEKDK